MRVFRNLAVCALLLLPVHAFVGPAGWAKTGRRLPLPSSPSFTRHRSTTPPVMVPRQRQSVAAIQTQGLFGLGVAEIAIILVGVGFVLGPTTIGKLVKGSAKQASALQEELTKVPAEFSKGLEEGESNARARKAKVVRPVKEEKKLPAEKDGADE